MSSQSVPRFKRKTKILVGFITAGLLAIVYSYVANQLPTPQPVWHVTLDVLLYQTAVPVYLLVIACLLVVGASFWFALMLRKLRKQSFIISTQVSELVATNVTLRSQHHVSRLASLD